MPRTLKETRATKAKAATKKAKTPAKPAPRQRKAAKAPAAVPTLPEPPKAAKAPVATPAAQAFADWQSGKPINELSTTYGIKRSKLRRLLIGLAGGKDAFKTLRVTTGAGGTVEPFGGKRATGGRVVGSIGSQDDSKVPRITSAKKSDGWTVRRIWRGTTVEVSDVGRVPTRELVATLHVSPDGIEYIEARPSEPADLLYVSESMKSTTRFRKYDESKLGKKIAKSERQEEEQVERGEIALERTRERKRKAKESRKKA